MLISQVRAVKNMGSRHFVLADAGFNDLMRPSMYGSYHHISAIAGDGRALDEVNTVESVVAGPLCESGDVFTQLEGGKVETRALPAVQVGIIWCSMIPALMALRCRPTTTAARCWRKCYLKTASRVRSAAPKPWPNCWRWSFNGL